MPMQGMRCEQTFTSSVYAWGMWLWGVNSLTSCACAYLHCEAWVWTGPYLLCLHMRNLRYEQVLPSGVSHDLQCDAWVRQLPPVFAHEKFYCEVWTGPSLRCLHMRSLRYEQALTSGVCTWGVWGVNRPLPPVFAHNLHCEVWMWTGPYLWCLRMTTSVMHGCEQALTLRVYAWGTNCEQALTVNRPLPPVFKHEEFDCEVWTGPYLLCLHMRSSSARHEVWTGRYLLCLSMGSLTVRYEQALTSCVCPWPPLWGIGVNRLLPRVFTHEEFDCEVWTGPYLLCLRMTSTVRYEQALTSCVCAWGAPARGARCRVWGPRWGTSAPSRCSCRWSSPGTLHVLYRRPQSPPRSTIITFHVNSISRFLPFKYYSKGCFTVLFLHRSSTSAQPVSTLKLYHLGFCECCQWNALNLSGGEITDAKTDIQCE